MYYNLITYIYIYVYIYVYIYICHSLPQAEHKEVGRCGSEHGEPGESPPGPTSFADADPKPARRANTPSRKNTPNLKSLTLTLNPQL